MARASRSQFIEKLHALLEHPYDNESLRWVSKDAFEITCNDLKARQALSPSWDFRSLSSFIRQLSYYSFKRLSDRRRSGERRASASGYIIFTHPSGLFVRGDPSKLHGIVRKARLRPSKGDGGRRASTSSVNSSGDSEDCHPLPLPSSVNNWPPIDPRYQSHHYQDERYSGHGQQYGSQLPQYHNFPTLRLPAMTENGGVVNTGSGWRQYNPSASAWGNPSHEEVVEVRDGYRRDEVPLPRYTKGFEQARPGKSPLLSIDTHNSNIGDLQHQRVPYPTPTFETAPYHGATAASGYLSPTSIDTLGTSDAGSLHGALPSPTNSHYSANSITDSPPNRVAPMPPFSSSFSSGAQSHHQQPPPSQHQHLPQQQQQQHYAVDQYQRYHSQSQQPLSLPPQHNSQVPTGMVGNWGRRGSTFE